MAAMQYASRSLYSFKKFPKQNWQLTWGTCDLFPSPRYMEYDVLHQVCLSRSECWQSPSGHHPIWRNCLSHLAGRSDGGNHFVLQNKSLLLIVFGICCNFTCIVLFFISNTEHRLHSPVRFADAVAAAHMPDYRGQHGRSEHYSHTK